MLKIQTLGHSKGSLLMKTKKEIDKEKKRILYSKIQNLSSLSTKFLTCLFI